MISIDIILIWVYNQSVNILKEDDNNAYINR